MFFRSRKAVKYLKKGAGEWIMGDGEDFTPMPITYYLATIKPTTTPLRSAADGIPISVKVFQNFELRAYFFDKSDCIL
jgi:hypothetical protein